MAQADRCISGCRAEIGASSSSFFLSFFFFFSFFPQDRPTCTASGKETARRMCTMCYHGQQASNDPLHPAPLNENRYTPGPDAGPPQPDQRNGVLSKCESISTWDRRERFTLTKGKVISAVAKFVMHFPSWGYRPLPSFPFFSLSPYDTTEPRRLPAPRAVAGCIASYPWYISDGQ